MHDEYEAYRRFCNLIRCSEYYLIADIEKVVKIEDKLKSEDFKKIYYRIWRENNSQYPKSLCELLNDSSHRG